MRSASRTISLRNQIRISIIQDMDSSLPDFPPDEHQEHGKSTLPIGTEQAEGAHALSSTVPLLQSAALLQGRKRVHIAHNGAYYQLQATRQGKLILTK